LTNELSKNACAAGSDILAAPESSANRIVNSSLNTFLGPAFTVGSGLIVDKDGTKSVTFPSVVYRQTRESENESDQTIPSDTVAAVIDVYDQLDIDTFRNAYSRIAAAKKLKKGAVPKVGQERTNVTLGIIFARHSLVPMEVLAQELYRLNLETSFRQWPDMIVVASMGVVNYAVQFPGETLSGDFLPPTEGAFKNGAPAFFVVVVMRPTGNLSFNKMLAFLIAHLSIFSPGLTPPLPKWLNILDGVPQTAITYLGFQPNLSGELVPVPRERYNDRLIPQIPVVIEDGDGNLLSTLEYVEWQDGGVLILTGKLPLEGLLIFFDPKKAINRQVIKLPNAQISYVLPIKRPDFDAFLNTIRQRSNLVINTKPGGFVIQKILDEGTTTPFVARCSLGLIRLREYVYPDYARRNAFDKMFEHALSSVSTARTASKDIAKMWAAHSERVRSGKIAQLDGRNIQILESIDREIAAELEKFLNASTRAVKTSMQNIANELGVNIGFLFKKRGAFEGGLSKLRQTDTDLADYIEQARNWTEVLITARNDLEHSIFALPRITYDVVNNSIEAREPKLLGTTVTQFAEQYFNRVACFFEEVTVHCLRGHLPLGTTLTEIPHGNRTPDAPERFQITLAIGGHASWRLRYHSNVFDDV